MKPPAFQFYADDFIGGTCDLSTADVGAYIRLLCYQWSRGAIPSEPDKLERVAGGKVSADVLAKFPDGKNERMEREREKQAAFREEQSRKGQAGAEKRWKNGSGHAPAMPRPLAESCPGHSPAIGRTMAEPSPGQWPNDGSPSPSSISYKHERERAGAERPSLAEVQAYAAQVGLAPWKAEDWFNEMEGCGWLDFNHRPVIAWRPLLVRVKTKWEADGRPTSPTASKHAQKPNAAHYGPSWREVAAYASEKDDAEKSATAYAAGWFRAWEGRGWKTKDGKTIDWKVKFSADLASRGVR